MARSLAALLLLGLAQGLRDEDVSLSLSEDLDEVNSSHASASGSFCCFYKTCGDCGAKSKPDDWCTKSKDNCEGNCKGVFCAGGEAGGAGEGEADKGEAEDAGKDEAEDAGKDEAEDAGKDEAEDTGDSGTAGDGKWDGTMKLSHYWDCSGQGCDSGTLNWDKFRSRYVSTPGYAPQDPADFEGGALYGEKMWITGAASDMLSKILGPNDGCCGSDPNDGGVGGCGKCVLLQNPQAENADWTVVAMKKNRCPPNSNGCKDESHFDLAVPGFDNAQYSTANICGQKPGTGFKSKAQSTTLGAWYNQCESTSKCAHLCDELPAHFQKGCKLFASWGWNHYKADPMVKFKHVNCPPEFVKHIGKQFGPDGPTYLKQHLKGL